ncbi:putative short chain dehydrogenase/ reductase [Hypoxylon sp. FL1284]|nr:putative short chain dehydrogenase/ reductase [Hypoxylon sp. FL1284]
MTSSFSGKLFVLTGAASGIARATATLLVRRGAKVSLADVDDKKLEEVKAELLKEPAVLENAQIGGPEPVLTTVVDVRSQQDCTAWIAATVAHFGQPIDGAANLAGVIGRSVGQEKGAVRNITDSEFDWVMDVNVKGTLNCLRAELPHMRAGEAGRNGSAIVNASSIAGITGVLYNIPYVASKHAIVGLTRTVAKEEGSRVIRANAIAPGVIETPMVKKIYESVGDDEFPGFGGSAPGALGRTGDAEEVAELVAFLLGPSSSFVNGTVVPIEGGWIC